MPIDQTSQFTMRAALPIESKMQVQTLNDRNSILTGERWEGMQVRVVDEATTYILSGGLDNTYWQPLAQGTVTPGDGSTFLADTLSDI